jgi:hypothetical protein
MLKQARGMARHLGLDRKVTVGDAKGFRVHVELADDLDRRALALLGASGDPAVLAVGEDKQGPFLVVKP